jgi:hypothetical protein
MRGLRGAVVSIRLNGMTAAKLEKLGSGDGIRRSREAEAFMPGALKQTSHA